MRRRARSPALEAPEVSRGELLELDVRADVGDGRVVRVVDRGEAELLAGAFRVEIGEQRLAPVPSREWELALDSRVARTGERRDPEARAVDRVRLAHLQG